MTCDACRRNKSNCYFPLNATFPFSHFSATIYMDSGVSAWVARMWISHPEFTSSDGYWWTGNSSTAISYAIHHHVKHSARGVFFYRNECSPVVGILRVWTHVRSPPRLWQSNGNKIALSKKHAVALSSPERVPNVIVNHQKRRRRNVLLSIRCRHALGHRFYFIIPPSTAMVDLFHYVAMGVHVLVVFVCWFMCTCMLLRLGFISTAAWVSLRPEIKLGGLRALSLRRTTARELVVIQTWLLEGKMRHAGLY